MAVKVLQGNAVEHDGVRYEAGEVIENIKDKEAQALVNSGVAVDANAQPSEAEVAATAEQAGQTSTEQTPEQKKGLFR